MLAGHVNFLDICNVIEDFLRNQAHIGFRIMQPCPFGQAYVRFNYMHERDLLIQTSPHQYGDVLSPSFRIIRHGTAGLP